MSAEQWADVLTSVAALVNALVWPLIVLVIVLRFAPQLIGLLGSGRDVTIKALGIEASFTKSVAEAAAALSAAEAKQMVSKAESVDASAATGDGPAQAEMRMPSPAQMARTLTTWVPDHRAQQDLQGATVLWVDDHPDNNRFEREALQALGVRFELSTTNEDALSLLGRRTFDAVISDLGRGLDLRAGFDLLDRLRRTDQSTPFFIYAGVHAARSREEALARGAQGCTSSPQELMALIIQAIRDRRSH